MSAPSLAVDVGVHQPDEAVQTIAKRFRTDIQLLRAWAVVIVVLNHARLPFLPGGFLGVDVFFVISGYLMTGLIDEGLDNGRFTFAGFYARRVRRLLPAAYATFLVTAAVAPLLLDATELHNFVAQLVGAFTFTANVVLWRQADYFGTQAAMKPLLHIWSLSLEEQYYLALPVALFACPSRFRPHFSVVLVLCSAAICAAFLTRNASATFYLLPSRAWELGVGSVVALLVRRNVLAPTSMAAVRWACVAVLLVLPMVANEEGHPGGVAAVICLATAVLLVPGATLDVAEPWLLPFSAVGDRSYSLYLAHWPVLAFVNNVFLTPVPPLVTAALLGLAAIWTELQYRLVEQPFRRFAIDARAIAVLFALPIAAMGASAWLSRLANSPDTLARTGGTGLAPACESKGLFAPPADCMSAASPRTLVWGDSFAMAVAPGLAASSPNGIVQATRSVCGPFLGLSPLNRGYGRRWGEDCISFNASVLDYLARHPEIETVALSSALSQYVPGAEDERWRDLVQTSDGFDAQPQGVAALLDAFSRTVAQIRRLGRRIVLVAPPPASSFDLARCQERVAEAKPTVTHHPDCTFSTADYRENRKAVLDVLATVRARNILPILDLDDRLCRTGRCQTRLNGTILYRDGAHLSSSGSIELGRDMGWGTLVERLAR